MRKVITLEYVSLDGVMESPEKWAFPYLNEEMGEANDSGMATSDAMLLGRVTYQEFASYWPYQTSNDGPIADYINNTPKFVVSTTLDTVEWQNSTLIRGNVVEELTRLKQQPGKNITILGSGALVQSLLRDDLIDEYRIMVFPVVVGSGKRLFRDGSDTKVLRLVETKSFSSGVVVLLTSQQERKWKSKWKREANEFEVCEGMGSCPDVGTRSPGARRGG